MKKVIVKDYLQLIGIKNFKGEDKMIDYYIIWPGKERIYAFSKKYFQNAWDTKNGLSLFSTKLKIN